jgi:hypothetical protein
MSLVCDELNPAAQHFTNRCLEQKMAAAAVAKRSCSAGSGWQRSAPPGNAASDIVTMQPLHAWHPRATAHAANAARCQGHRRRRAIAAAAANDAAGGSPQAALVADGSRCQLPTTVSNCICDWAAAAFRDRGQACFEAPPPSAAHACALPLHATHIAGWSGSAMMCTWCWCTPKYRRTQATLHALVPPLA